MTYEEPGGYQRDAGRPLFGVGTLKPCLHEATAIYDGQDWHIQQGRSKQAYAAPSWAQPGDVAGTVRCLGCGNKVER